VNLLCAPLWGWESQAVSTSHAALWWTFFGDGKTASQLRPIEHFHTVLIFLEKNKENRTAYLKV